jgi:hypothetical protein
MDARMNPSGSLFDRRSFQRDRIVRLTRFSTLFQPLEIA